MKYAGMMAIVVAFLGLTSIGVGNVFNLGGTRNLDGSWNGLASLETVPVGNPNNTPDLRYGGYGSVSYTYNIGKYEVTAGQYCEFLNAVADTDTYGLYNTAMDTAVSFWGCNIKRTGSSGNYQYSVAADWANRPLNYVGWGDAARFANWLHNGQPTGSQGPSTTEDGAYYLNGAMTDADLLAVSRKSGCKWAIAGEDEWYKAAYYNPATSTYYDYPTGSNSVPLKILSSGNDPGNNATYYNNGYTIGSPYYRTEAGAHENSDSPYGTFDQGGNVWEWNEAIITSYDSVYRCLRGGTCNHNGTYLLASTRTSYNPAAEGSVLGFRVVQIPEPGCLILLALGGAALIRRR